MDFLDPKKKRAQRIRLNIGYALMAILLSLITAVVLLITYGYSLDRRTGDVIQNGLIFVSAHPDGAVVSINGVDKDRTDSRYVLPSGSYDIKLSQPGYRSWQQNLKLEGGRIERLTYPVLFPEQLISNDVSVYNEAPLLTTQSPDKRWLVVQPGVTSPNLQLYDLNAESVSAAALALPPNLVSVGGSWQLVEWSNDNRHILLRYAMADKVEYIVVDRQVPGSSINLTTNFNRPSAGFRLRDKRFDQFYIHGSDQSLAQANLDSKSVTPMISHVVAFQPEGNNFMAYVTPDNAKSGHVLVRLIDGTNSYTLREIPVANRYYIEVNRYSGQQYVAVGDSSLSRAYLYRSPIDQLRKEPNALPTAFGLLRVGNMTGLSFSPNGRFISLQGGSEFAIYDAEENRQPRFDTKLPLSDPSQQAAWMDDSHLMLTSDNKLNVFDFDGTNRQQLNAVYPQYRPYFDRDGHDMYTISPSLSQPGRNALLRTNLRVQVRP